MSKTSSNGGDVQEVPKKLRIEMLEREVHGLDIELSNLYKEHVVLLQQIEHLQRLRREAVEQIDRTNN